MKVSGYTFIRNGEMLGFPFVESIKSALPVCDEFVVNVGKSADDTLERIKAIGSDKIRIIESEWNDKVQDRGFVYAQQKMVAQYNCTGDWAFYLEGDEVLHEDDLPTLEKCMRNNLERPEVEAIVFDYLHFYGNRNTTLWSPGWYRRAPRIIRNSIRSYCVDGLFFLVLDKNKTARYPRAVVSGATMYHYGWVRDEAAMNLKAKQVQQFWGHEYKPIDYSQIDGSIFREFKGSHPAAVRHWLPEAEGLFAADPDYVPGRKERKHRNMLRLEALFGLELSKKHFKRVRGA